MRFGWSRLVVLLVFSVAILQVIHLLLLNSERIVDVGSKALNSTMKSSTSSIANHIKSALAKRRQRPIDLSRDVVEMMNVVRSSSVLDANGEYMIVKDLARPASNIGSSDSDVYEDVTLVTQCSADQLHHLILMADYWSGPISATVFVTKSDFASTLLTLGHMRNCNKNVLSSVSFHLVYSLSDSVQNLTTADLEVRAPWKCPNLRDGESATMSAINYGRLREVPYPNNLLRNVARENARTLFIFVVDVDMVTSRDLRQRFVAFAEAEGLFSEFVKRNEKTVYVVPSYELREFSAIPENKQELLDAVKESRAQPFYWKVCAKCQKYTNYEAWEREPVSSRLDAVYDVPWMDPWEPFYVARNTVPTYDERFKQYGFNRISQVCETHVAGYTFTVLNNAFLVHKGFKSFDSFHSKKDFDQERNRLLFRLFKMELKEKYPMSTRRCY